MLLSHSHRLSYPKYFFHMEVKKFNNSLLDTKQNLPTLHLASQLASYFWAKSEKDSSTSSAEFYFPPVKFGFFFSAKLLFLHVQIKIQFNISCVNHIIPLNLMLNLLKKALDRVPLMIAVPYPLFGFLTGPPLNYKIPCELVIHSSKCHC